MRLRHGALRARGAARSRPVRRSRSVRCHVRAGARCWRCGAALHPCTQRAPFRALRRCCVGMLFRRHGSGAAAAWRCSDRASKRTQCRARFRSRGRDAFRGCCAACFVHAAQLAAGHASRPAASNEVAPSSLRHSMPVRQALGCLPSRTLACAAEPFDAASRCRALDCVRCTVLGAVLVRVSARRCRPAAPSSTVLIASLLAMLPALDVRSRSCARSGRPSCPRLIESEGRASLV